MGKNVKLFRYDIQQHGYENFVFFKADKLIEDLIYTPSLKNMCVLLLFLLVSYWELLHSSFWVKKLGDFKLFL